MGSQYTQLLILLLAIGAPAISWIFGKLREQAELKKARDTAKRRQDDSLRTTQLTNRSAPAPTPETQRERERQELAARRQAQLRELRQRQYERATRPGTVVRGPAPTGARPQVPQMPRQPTPRSPGPLRPGIPAPPTTARRTPPVAAPARPGPGRPMPAPARPTPPSTARRSTGAPPPVARPRVEPAGRKPAPTPVAKTEAVARGHNVEVAREHRGVGRDVRGMLIGPDGETRSRADLARAIALTEVFGPPISLRLEDQLSWDRL